MSDAALIVGIGNIYRSDDGVGPVVAGALAERGLNTAIHAGDGTGLMDLFEKHESVVLIDATRSNAEPGTLIVLDAAAKRLSADLFHYSTHRFGLAEAVETARALGTLPKKLIVCGIEGAEFGAGTDLSPQVARAANALIAYLASSLGAGS
ncbi:MAG: hydrogenase maturation protease [Oricola sp.]